MGVDGRRMLARERPIPAGSNQPAFANPINPSAIVHVCQIPKTARLNWLSKNDCVAIKPFGQCRMKEHYIFYRENWVLYFAPISP